MPEVVLGLGAELGWISWGKEIGMITEEADVWFVGGSACCKV